MALTRSMAYHPEVQHAIAEMAIELESIGPHLDTVAHEWSKESIMGRSGRLNFSAKYRAVEGAWRVVDLGLEVCGGAGIFRS